MHYILQETYPKKARTLLASSIALSQLAKTQYSNFWQHINTVSYTVYVSYAGKDDIRAAHKTCTFYPGEL